MKRLHKILFKVIRNCYQALANPDPNPELHFYISTRHVNDKVTTTIACTMECICTNTYAYIDRVCKTTLFIICNLDILAVST